MKTALYSPLLQSSKVLQTFEIKRQMSKHDVSIEQLLAKRARHLRGAAQRDSPHQRMKRFGELQRSSFLLLRSSPHGYQHFLHRNYRSRRAEVVDGQWRPVSADRRAVSP
ncbi:MAG: hypothetical protein GTO76_06510 [Planctomycetales bacterium]|nr:hypothetical protein [Planctomycetales bacterium]NIN08304.1 hypothetical protein [Planctomycetales bacterium]NIP04482.1 hypothetical protein [Planctomycetales bacterium]